MNVVITFLLAILLNGCVPLANEFNMTYSGDLHDNDGKVTEDFAVKMDDEAHSK